MRCRQITFVISLIMATLPSGCSRLITEYGKSSGQSGRESLNGFGAFRQTFENSGFQCRNATRLTNRVMRCDAIIWTPQLLSQIDTEATVWLDRWLGTGDKTLVYVVPDSGSESEYYRGAAKLADPEQRMSYRRKVAKLTNQQMKWRLARTQVQDSGWFDINPSQGRQPIGQVQGEWATHIEISDSEAESMSIELTISESTAADNAATVAANFFGNIPSTGPAQPTFPYPVDTEPSETPVVMQPVLETGLDQTIVAEITSEDWKDSRILVVAGGSLLTNYAFTRPANRQLAEQIVAAAKIGANDEPTAAFVTSRWSMIGVSDGKPGIPKATGMELLTVWPISLVTMHGVMLGLVIGLAVLPIFGRPRRIQVNRQRDFGDHLDAVAALMNRAGDEEFARHRIQEYRRRVHGEAGTNFHENSESGNEEPH